MMIALENALQNPTNPLSSHLLKLGFDVFSKKMAAEDAFGGENIDESKLQNIASCENKRLMRFAAEFPFEQHLLNLQSILVSLLDKLSRHLTDQTTSIAEFHRELSRIAVLLQELDIELAKAKRRKDFANYAEHRATLVEEELIKLAAELNKGKGSYQRDYRLEMQARYQAMQKEADNLKAKEAAEKAERSNAMKQEKRRQLRQHIERIIAERTKPILLAMHYRKHLAHLIKLKTEQALKRKIEERVERILRAHAIHNAEDLTSLQEVKDEIVSSTLTRYRLTTR